MQSLLKTVLYYGLVALFGVLVLFDANILELLIWVPIIVGLALFNQNNSPNTARWLALTVSAAMVALLVPFIQGYDMAGGMQYVVNKAWLPGLDIRYALGVDGFAMPLVALTTFFTPIVVLSAWQVIKKRVGAYMGSFLILQGLMVGVFSALDSILFYIFFEAMLIPMFLVIGIWGGPNRIYATVKFFLFTFLGSIFMLIALLYLAGQARAVGIDDPFMITSLAQVKVSAQAGLLIALAFLAAFAVKIPMWPVHTWLPDAHVEAPTGGSVILAAIMLKIGGYGMLRFMLPIVPQASAVIAPYVIGFSLVAIVYISLVAIVQTDMKKLIAYSSVAHMGFVTLGIFTAFASLGSSSGAVAAEMGLQGAYVQMISHGFISGALFLCVGVMYDRVHSRLVQDYGGVVNTMPKFAALFMLFILANCGLPGTSGFVGEFLVIVASFNAHWVYALLAATTLVFGAAYSLWLYKRVVFGKVANTNVANMQDINLREMIVLGILAVMVLALGLYPAPLTGVTQPAVQALLQSLMS